MIKSNFEYPRKVSNPTRQIRQISPTVLLSNCEVSDTLHFPKQAFHYNDVMHLYRMRIMELRKKMSIMYLFKSFFLATLSDNVCHRATNRATPFTIWQTANDFSRVCHKSLAKIYFFRLFFQVVVYSTFLMWSTRFHNCVVFDLDGSFSLIQH